MQDANLQLWVVCQYFSPESGAAAARMRALTQHWQVRGAQVTMLTGVPSYPDGVVPEAYRDKPIFFVEALDGVMVRRHWLPATPAVGPRSRLWPLLAAQLTFSAALLWRNWRLSPELPRPVVVVASSPTFLPCVSAWLLARRHGAKFVLETRELWPDLFIQTGLLKDGGVFARAFSALERWVYRRSDVVVALTRRLAHVVVARMGGQAAPERVRIVPTGVSDRDLQLAAEARGNNSASRLRAQLGLSPLSKVVLYIGSHGDAQGLGQVIDAARLLVRRTDVVFLMVGSGPDKDRLIAYAKGVPNVQFLPAVAYQDVWTYYALADLNVVCLKNLPDYEMMVPYKIFEIMAARGCAVAGLQGEAAEIVQESGCALVVPSEDPEKMANALTTLLDDPVRREQMAQAGRAYVEQHFRGSYLAEGYLQLCRRLVGLA